MLHVVHVHVHVLPEHVEETVGVHAVYPEQKHLSARVRLFIDQLVEHLGPTPPWRRLT